MKRLSLYNGPYAVGVFWGKSRKGCEPTNEGFRGFGAPLGWGVWGGRTPPKREKGAEGLFGGPGGSGGRPPPGSQV